MTNSFSVNGALFPQTADDMKARMKEKYDPSKNYPNADGVVNIPADQAFALADYILQGKPNDRNEIPLAISGWKQTSKPKDPNEKGKEYISLSFRPHYKYEKNVEGSEACSVNSAAQSVAKSTDGSVIDIF